jgi:hypothetical protein
MKNKETKVILIIVGAVLLICCSLAGIFAVLTLFAARPRDAFEQARNVQRTSDINTLTNALSQYTVTEGNSLDDFDIPSCPQVAAIGTGSRSVDLGALVPLYLATLPLDPVTGSEDDTGYEICLEGNSVVISAPHAESGEKISVRR